MNKFDITELPKQWLVALVALAFTLLAGGAGLRRGGGR